jgi:alginate O-acetyltransferase complex protein AlgI
MILLLLVPPALVAASFLVHRRKAPASRPLLWATLVLGVAATERALAHEPPAVRMAGMVVVAFLAVKAMVGEEEKRDGMEPLPFGRWLRFATLWIGMRPRLFATRGRRPVAGARDLLVRGATRLAAGILLVFAAALVGTSRASDVLLGGGLLLVFHFGACTLLAAAWRARGIRCDPIVKEPARSRSLTEFWSRRWNVAYSEMCTILLYRPLAGRVGRRTSVALVFLFSGFLHEMAISLPVRAGYGLPTLYFALHGVLVLVEEALARRGRPLRGLLGRIWTLFWIVAPLPILFHRPFVTQVLRPLLGS